MLKLVSQKLRRTVSKCARKLRELRAVRHRSVVAKSGKIQWIGVTGSCGKSTTVHLLAEVLSKSGRCLKPTGGNLPVALPFCILRVTPEHKYIVQEIGTESPGHIRHNCRMFRPEIGVVMNVGSDHYAQFRSEDAIAEEKADLVRSLPATGVAILNADDHRVAAMAGESKARIVTFGIEKDADYRARDVSAQWPATVGFMLEHQGKSYSVATQLFGAHLAPNVLACVAAAHSCGIPIDDVIEQLRSISPVEGRMSQMKTQSGVTFMRDDFKAPWWGLPLTIEFLTRAMAKRKVLVLGEMSDNPGNKARKFRRLINSALDQLDLVVVVGEAAGQLNESLRNNEKVKACHTILEADKFLNENLRTGDLVVVKGIVADHLERLARARVETVGCWRSRCGRKVLCSECDLMATPAGGDEPIPSRK